MQKFKLKNTSVYVRPIYVWILLENVFKTSSGGLLEHVVIHVVWCVNFGKKNQSPTLKENESFAHFIIVSVS